MLYEELEKEKEMEEGAYYSTSLIHHTPNLIYYYNPGAFIVQTRGVH